MDFTLHTRAKHLLRQQLQPYTQQTEILRSISELELILEQLSQEQYPEAKVLQETIIYGLENLTDRTSRYLLSPKLQNTTLRMAIEQIQSSAQQATFRWSAKEQTTKHIIIERKGKKAETFLSKTGGKQLHFSHIPYSAIATEDIAYFARTAAKAGQKIHQEKTYRSIPFRATKSLAWNLELVGLPKAWEYGQAENTHIGIIDTGVDYTHSELAARFGSVRGYNFVAETDDPMDDNGHGTHVSGTTAGQSVGIATASTLYGLKFLDSQGWGTEVGFIRAAEWAIDNGLHVLNGSFGSSSGSDAEEAICTELQQRNILFCAAAGNDGTWDYNYPASYATVVSVAAVDKYKQRAPFSQQNNALNISGPGVDVHSCVPGGYDTYSGTSMATPHVTGCAALLHSAYTDNNFVRELLEKSAENLGSADEYGAGLVRADQAFSLATFVKRWAA